jgi:hypothetical protein
MNKFLQRLKEPSTYAGLSALGGLGVAFKINELAMFAAPEFVQSVMVVGTVLSGLAAMVMGEKKDEPKA